MHPPAHIAERYIKNHIEFILFLCKSIGIEEQHIFMCDAIEKGGKKTLWDQGMLNRVCLLCGYVFSIFLHAPRTRELGNVMKEI